MDSKIKFKVLESDYISNSEIIVKLNNAIFGLAEKEVLKSIERNIFWEIQTGKVLTNDERRWYFENENVNENHIIENFKIIGIGHFEKPYINEYLVLHSTTFRQKIQVKEIYDNYALLENEFGYFGVIPKRKIPKWVEIGDFVRHCEHQFHDLVDVNENFIYRR